MRCTKVSWTRSTRISTRETTKKMEDNGLYNQEESILIKGTPSSYTFIENVFVSCTIGILDVPSIYTNLWLYDHFTTMIPLGAIYMICMPHFLVGVKDKEMPYSKGMQTKQIATHHINLASCT